MGLGLRCDECVGRALEVRGEFIFMAFLGCRAPNCQQTGVWTGRSHAGDWGLRVNCLGDKTAAEGLTAL